MNCIYCSSDTRVVNSRLQKRPNRVWRRRRCKTCDGVFTSVETVDLSSSLLFEQDTTHVEPFQRDILFISIYNACQHRKDAQTAATALTDTILARLQTHIARATLTRHDVISITSEVLKRFDRAAAVQYLAYHPD